MFSEMINFTKILTLKFCALLPFLHIFLYQEKSHKQQDIDKIVIYKKKMTTGN